MIAEPRMEDLLASIRKAMDAEQGKPFGATQAQEPGALMRGALREMRVAFEKPETAAEKPDVEALRSRVQRNSAASGFSAPPLPPIAGSPDDVTQRQGRNGFAAILAGLKQATPPPIEEAPSFLRRSMASDDDVAEDIEYAEEGAAAFEPMQQAPLQQAYEDQQPYAEEELELEQPAYQPTAYAPPPPPPHIPQRRAPPRARPAPPPPPVQQRALVSEPAAQASRRSFEDLAEALLSRATSDRSLEDMTREMLRGMLRQWLDENLPEIVERLVREEIERVARRGN